MAFPHQYCTRIEKSKSLSNIGQRKMLRAEEEARHEWHCGLRRIVLHSVDGLESGVVLGSRYGQQV